MRFNRHSLWAIVGGILFGTLAANAQTPAALTGRVTSAQEATMEGVLVSAKREGTTITTTVVTNEQGRYAFPADRLQPGKYTISIRAARMWAAPYESLPSPLSRRVTSADRTRSGGRRREG